MRHSLCTVVAVLGAASYQRVTVLAKSNADGGSYALDRPTFAAGHVNRYKDIGYTGEPMGPSGFSTDDREKNNCPASCKCGVSSRPLGIIGGRPTSVKEYPWMALVRTSASSFCGGSVINNRYVMTAAHCVFKKTGHKMNASHLTVELQRYKEDKVMKYNVKYILPHKDYKPEKKGIEGFDIALLRLDTGGLDFGQKSGILPVCLPPKGDSFAGYQGIITGWGKTKAMNFSDVLLEASVHITENSYCKTYWPFLTHDMLCAKDPMGEKMPCIGDSGGPLIIKQSTAKKTTSYVVGIITGGCNITVVPTIYTRVNKFLNWLVDNTKDACSCSEQ